MSVESDVETLKAQMAILQPIINAVANGAIQNTSQITAFISSAKEYSNTFFAMTDKNEMANTQAATNLAQSANTIYQDIHTGYDIPY